MKSVKATPGLQDPGLQAIKELTKRACIPIQMEVDINILIESVKVAVDVGYLVLVT